VNGGGLRMFNERTLTRNASTEWFRS